MGKLTKTFSEGIRDLFPAYFALVMATGIVSIACHLLELDWLAFPLFYLNIFFYVLLCVLILARIIRFPAQFLADLTDHARSPGFFTLVAGTNVLGSQFVLLASNQAVALGLWMAALLVWLVLIFTFFTVMTVKEQKPGLEGGISGAWMLIVVSTQSVTVLGMLIASRFAAWKDMFEFTMLGFYLLGCMFYILIISLILYRFLFLKIDPKDMTPPYWINMGAVAITTLAGANILLRGDAAFLATLTPFIQGFTLFFWAAGTWWIPLLFLLGAWRHIYKRYPLTYHPLYWGLVFPMGMYTVCTFQLSRAMDLPFLMVIPRLFIYFALLAWGITLIGLLHSLGKKLLH
jgi:tellurite resistance protein TehA-like permease